MLKEFRDFAMRGNVLDLAVGFIMGAAFGKIVTSLVSDIIMPPIGLILGGLDFSQIKWVLKAAVGGDPTTEVAIRFGNFINLVIAFVVVAAVVYLVAKVMIKEEEAAPTKTCPACKEANAVDATRCRACTSDI